MQTSLILLKPDTVERGFIGDVIQRIEQKGLQMSAMKMIQLDREILEDHYYHVAKEEFFPRIARYMMRIPVLALAISGKNAIRIVRNITGKTDPTEDTPGNIRGDFGLSYNTRVIHASDSQENAQRELELFFDKKEIFEYSRSVNSIL